MHVDCLLDENALSVINGSAEEVREFIKKNQPFPLSYRVYEGLTNKLFTVGEYMEVTGD